jgi:hypothetical protein
MDKTLLWSEIRQKIEDIYDKYFMKIMENKFKTPEDIKNDLKNLDAQIDSLNLFANIPENKYNEIQGLINNTKENLKVKIENEINYLKCSHEKYLLIQKGYTIMLNKSNDDLGTNDINEIKNILLNEVLNTPGFFDTIHDESKKSEIINKLETDADTIGKQYLEKHSPQIKYFPATPYNGVSIVDGLRAIGEISSFDYRTQIAARNGISNYFGKIEQNAQMLNLLKQGKLVKP